MQTSIPYLLPKWLKSIPFGAAHTYIAHIVSIPPPRGTRTNNKLNPHMTPSTGIEPGPHWWGASALTCSHHCAIPALHFNHFYIWCTFALNFSKKISMVWETISDTRKSVWSDFQTHRSWLKEFGCASCWMKHEISEIDTDLEYYFI